ncbi:MAG TPA: TcmI family type II polyketide cyclase [Mycobacteriales bacterium]|jgi:Polyketide synthesis cyclase.
MHRTLIVARMEPTEIAAVAEIFAESDAGELPGLVGATHRALFSFHGLYLHLVESHTDVGTTLPLVRDNPAFREVNTRLASHIRPYDPGWREPKDAMAQQFYDWSAQPAERVQAARS